MAVEFPSRIHAQAILESGVAPAFRFNNGFASLVRNGLGDYTLFYDQELVSLVAHVELGARDVPSSWQITPLLTNDGVRIQTNGGSGPADIDFAITVFSVTDGEI